MEERMREPRATHGPVTGTHRRPMGLCTIHPWAAHEPVLLTYGWPIGDPWARPTSAWTTHGPALLSVHG